MTLLFYFSYCYKKYAHKHTHTDLTFSLNSAGLMPCGANWCALLILPELGVTDLDIGAMSTDTHYRDRHNSTV